MENDAFIKMPFLARFELQGLNYKDVLTYITVRSFNNVVSDRCYPSYETIAKRMGCGKQFIMESVDRLEQAEHIKVIHSEKARLSNRYLFPALETFIKIPYEIFHLDLNVNEKAMLLCIKNAAWDINEYHGNFYDLGKRLGVSYNVVYKQCCNLVQNGFIDVIKQKMGQAKRMIIKLTDKVNWDLKAKEMEHAPVNKPVLILI